MTHYYVDFVGKFSVQKITRLLIDNVQQQNKVHYSLIWKRRDRRVNRSNPLLKVRLHLLIIEAVCIRDTYTYLFKTGLRTSCVCVRNSDLYPPHLCGQVGRLLRVPRFVRTRFQHSPFTANMNLTRDQCHVENRLTDQSRLFLSSQRTLVQYVLQRHDRHTSFLTFSL